MHSITRPAVLLALLAAWSPSLAEEGPLPGTKPLDWEGDIAAKMVDGIDRFLLAEIEAAKDRRERHWERDFSSPDAYAESIEPNRRRLSYMLGLRDERVPFDAPELDATTERPALIAQGRNYDVYAVRWPAFGDVHGEGLLLAPVSRPRREAGDSRTLELPLIAPVEPVADVVVIPDAGETPEQLAGLEGELKADQQLARRLAAEGCRVLVPAIVPRTRRERVVEGQPRGTLSDREFLHRSAYELGRTLPGYEVQKVLAAVDWFVKNRGEKKRRIGVAGYGEGGMIALYAAAVDTRIDACLVSGFFGPREGVWREPIDRNVFGLLDEFGGAELASMVLPRKLIVEAAPAPEVSIPGEGGAPAEIPPITHEEVEREWVRALKITGSDLRAPMLVDIAERRLLPHPYAGDKSLALLREALNSKPDEEASDKDHASEDEPPAPLREEFDIDARTQRQFHELDRHNQWLLSESPYVRRQFINWTPWASEPQEGDPPAPYAHAGFPKELDFSSPEAYAESIEPYREFFREEVIGEFDRELLPPDPRARKSYDEEKWTGYEVVLDVFPDVFAYGILLVPKDIKEGERRPVVVCQHGLEGRPQDIVSGDHRAYHDFAAELAGRGFVTFAPQNIYIGQDRFRTLQRKAYPLKKTLFSIMVPQHRQITGWLKSLPFVDGARIAFYGLSYGGKSAMRIPPLVEDYCLSICSADFNEWVWKNASSRARYSYVYTGEYEIFEWDLGSTFNYAEMAALIAPRPFMVERGHFDGVAPDEMVAYEFARVRHLYAARLGLERRCAIDWFAGPHTIHGEGSFEFLHEHLDWPAE